MFYLLIKRAALVGLIALALSSLEGGLFASGSLATPNSPLPVTSGNRSIYLNGIDISSARNQDLRNVHIKISDGGDIYISAPQYQVTEEETFLPLSSYTSKSPLPEHKAPQAMSAPKLPSENVEKSPSKPATAPSTESANPPSSPVLPAQPASNLPPKTGR
jgi:hypothetical protein